MNTIIDKMKSIFSEDGLKAKAMKGSFWLGIGSGSEQGFRFLRNIILARIIAPEAFGLMAIILLVNAAFESFTQIGIKEAIIQNPRGEERTYLNGAWFMAIGRACLLFIAGFVSSSWIADFYDIPQSIFLLRISMISIILNGAISIGAYIALKQMNYKKWVMIVHGGGLIGIFTAIGLSFLIPNEWALVLGFLTEAVAKCVLSYVLCPFLPQLRFDKEHIRSMLQYSKGMFGLPILYFIHAQMDIFIVGKIFSKNELGLYSMTATLAQSPSVIMTFLINPILMPVFSKKQKDGEWINSIILKSTEIIILAGLPLVLFTIYYGKDLLTVAYGSPYAVMANAFTILFVATVVRSVGIPIANLYLAIGRPELHRFFSGVRAVLIILLIYPSIKWFGLLGAALAVLLSTAISIIPQVSQMRKLTGLSLGSFKNILSQAFVISIVIGVLFYVFRANSSSMPAVNLFQGLIGCILSYSIIVIFYLKRRTKLQAELRN